MNTEVSEILRNVIGGNEKRITMTQKQIDEVWKAIDLVENDTKGKEGMSKSRKYFLVTMFLVSCHFLMRVFGAPAEGCQAILTAAMVMGMHYAVESIEE